MIYNYRFTEQPGQIAGHFTNCIRLFSFIPININTIIHNGQTKFGAQPLELFPRDKAAVA
jgi:hypothetical protein